LSEKLEEKVTHVFCSFCRSFVKEASIIRTPKGTAFICDRCKKREEEPKKYIRKYVRKEMKQE